MLRAFVDTGHTERDRARDCYRRYRAAAVLNPSTLLDGRGFDAAALRHLHRRNRYPVVDPLSHP